MDDWLRTLLGSGGEGVAMGARLLVLATVFGAVPSVLLLTTCFPRIVIVLGFLRRALGTQDLPPNQVTAGLAMALTALVMFPVWKRVHDEAYLPLSRGEEKSIETALERAAVPLKEFMLAHTLRSDLRLFIEFSESRDSSGADAPGGGTGGERTPATEDEPVEKLSFFVILPAFVLSELKAAFQIGFLLYLPFLVIDFAVSAILISMGMFMLPPVLISLPLKVLVFVLVDGWNLIVSQLLAGLQGAI